MSEAISITPTDARTLSEGGVPEDISILRKITVGQDNLLNFLSEQYLDSYIPDGGSKIKMVTGRPGVGKTNFSRLMLAEAEDHGYLTVHFSAESVWLHDFREVYLEVLRQCDLEKILQGCADMIIQKMGYDPSEISEGKTFMDFLSETGNGDVIGRNEIRTYLREMFTRNPLLDNNFASCCSLIVGGKLGYPPLEASAKELLMAFLHGDKTVKFSMLRALGLSPARITKYNARHLLRSLAETVHNGGFKGILIVIDDMEILQDKHAQGPVRYTKVRREDTYESIRQLIDDIDSMRYLMFLLCFDRVLMDNDDIGIKSYQALWMRIQNEVVSPRFNAFADIIDLDRYADQFYTTDVLCEMAARLAGVLQYSETGVPVLDEDAAMKLIEQSQYGGLGLPYLVNRKVIEIISDGRKQEDSAVQALDAGRQGTYDTARNFASGKQAQTDDADQQCAYNTARDSASDKQVLADDANQQCAYEGTEG